MLNDCKFMGRLTADPEVKTVGSGATVASFTVAVDRDYKPEGGDRETDFIQCSAWRHTGEFISKYFQKGRMICVSGRLEVRSYTDKEGNKRRSWQINVQNAYFCGDGKREAQSGSQGGYPAPMDIPPEYEVLTGYDPQLPFQDEYEQLPFSR